MQSILVLLIVGCTIFTIEGSAVRCSFAKLIFISLLLSTIVLLFSSVASVAADIPPDQQKAQQPKKNQKTEIIITQPSITKVPDAKVPEEKSVELLSSPGLPGRKFYFKVNTPGIEAERVSVLYNDHVISLKPKEKGTWKGEFDLPKEIKPGSHDLTIYVADTGGHLHKGITNFEVKPLPEPKVKTTALYIDVINKFEVSVPPEINKATLVLGDYKISLTIRDGIASAKFYLNKDTKRKVLYLSDNDGHLFRYELALKVEDNAMAKEAKEDLVLRGDDSNFIFYVLLGLTGLGLVFAFFQWRKG